jgi:hypothetical protein
MEMGAVTAPNARVLLLTLSERTSAKGRRYMSGWLGKASVVAFEAERPDRYGNKVWELFASTPEPRAEGKPAEFADTGRGEERPAQAPARPPERREDWNGSRYRRPRPGAPGASPADYAPFDDSLEDIGQ